MATEIAIRDESVLQIGEVISTKVGQLLPPPSDTVQQMTPFDSMITVLKDIRDGIHNLVDKFSDSVSIQNQALDRQEMQEDMAAVQSTEEQKEDKPGFLDSMREKAEAIQPALEAAAFAAGFLALAAFLSKYAKDIAAVITPLTDAVGNFVGSVQSFVGTVVDEAKRFAELTPEGGLLALPLASFLIRNQFLKVSQAVGGFFTGLGTRFADIIKLVTESKIFQTVKNFGTKAGEFFSKIGGVFRSLFGFFINNPAVRLIFSIAKTAGNLLRGVPVVGQVIQAIIGAFSAITGAITGFKDGGIIGAITGAVKGLYDGLVGSFLNLITGALAYISEKLGLQFLADFLKDLDFRADSLIKFFTDTLPGYFTEIVPMLIEKFGDIVNSVSEKVKGFKDKVVTGISNFLIMLKDKITAPFVGIVSAVKGAAGALVDKIPLISDERKMAIKESLGLNDVQTVADNGNDYQMDAQGNIIDKEGNIMTVDEKTGAFVKAPINTDIDAGMIISPDKRQDGKNINQDSAALGAPPSQSSNMQINKGGNTTTASVNNAYLSYERTSTSDAQIHSYLRS